MKTTALLLSLFLAAATSADDLERSVALMAKTGSAYAPSFSPDSSRIAFITNISGSPQVWIIPAAGGYPRQVTALEDPVTAMLWAPRGEWIAIQVAPGGGLNSQIYVVRPDGTGLRRLTAGGKENNWLGEWTPDSKALVIGSNQRSGDSVDSWVLDIASGEMRSIAQSQGISVVLDISVDGRYALIDRLRNRGDNDIYRVSMAGGEEILLTRHTPPAEFDQAQFGATPDVVYMTGNPDRDRSALLRVRIAGGKPGPMEVLASRTDAELAGITLDESRAADYLVWNVAGRSEVTKLVVDGAKQSKVTELPADIVADIEVARSGSAAAFVLSGSNRIVDIWITPDGSSFRQLTFSPHPGIDLSSFVRPELVTYKAHDGLELSGWLYRPRDAKPPYATVLSFHGGPEGQERPTFNSTYQALAMNGMAVFAPNVRGSAGFGKKFVNLDNGALRVNGVRDIKATTDHLVTAGISDPKRLGIMGGSYGGYMVMAGVTEYPDLFAAGANLFGIINFETFFKHSEPWMAAISTIEYGNPATEAAMLRTLSPIHKVDRIRTPLLVLHGANDTNVPVIEAEQTVESLKKRNVPVEYILFPDEGHGWRKTPNRIRSTVSIVRFFKERLKP